MKCQLLPAELQRRRVFRVAITYVVAAWAVIQVGDVVLPRVGLLDRTLTLLIVLALLGFPLALVPAAIKYGLVMDHYVLTNPLLGNLRGDPRFQPLVAEVKAEADRTRARVERAGL